MRSSYFFSNFSCTIDGKKEDGNADNSSLFTSTVYIIPRLRFPHSAMIGSKTDLDIKFFFSTK